MAYQALFNRVLVRIPPERAHHWAMSALRISLASDRIATAYAARAFAPEIALDALGQHFHSPLGVAAGLDKNATALGALGALGFGAVEIGTVTPLGQPGNPEPRIIRAVDDHALVNAMGFPNDGVEAVAVRLAGRTAPGHVPGAPVLGANLGKNSGTPLERAAEDYAAVARRLAPLADYLVLNVSSPNTPGLRSLETVAGLAPIITAVKPLIGATPLLVKISPDLADADVDAVADLAASEGLAGVIATNTTVDRGVLSDAGRRTVDGFAGGGVSGPPVAERSRAVLARLYARLRGTETIVISAGGVADGAEAWERILAGATLVQAYTGFVYGGPRWPARVNHELAARVRGAGAASIAELIGTGADR